MELSQFKDFLIGIDCSDLTISAYSNDLAIFSDWYRQTNGVDLQPSNLTSSDVRDYKQFLLVQKHSSPATINRKLASIRMYAKWAVESKLIPFNPVSGVKNVDEQQLSPKWLTRLEQASLLREAEKQILSSHTPRRLIESRRNHSIIELLLNTGIRLNELCSLEIQDVQLSERKGHLTVRNGKGMKMRVVPLNHSARKAIQDWLTIRAQNPSQKLFVGMKGELKPRAVQEIVQGLGEKAHIKVTPHSLRHSFAKNLIDTNRVSLDKVGMLCGHKSLNTTKNYCIPSLGNLQQSVDFLDD